MLERGYNPPPRQVMGLDDGLSCHSGQKTGMPPGLTAKDAQQDPLWLSRELPEHSAFPLQYGSHRHERETGIKQNTIWKVQDSTTYSIWVPPAPPCSYLLLLSSWTHPHSLASVSLATASSHATHWTRSRTGKPQGVLRSLASSRRSQLPLS